jgi:hypothetical protein
MAACNGNGMNHKIKQFMHKLANARTWLPRSRSLKLSINLSRKNWQHNMIVYKEVPQIVLTDSNSEYGIWRVNISNTVHPRLHISAGSPYPWFLLLTTCSTNIRIRIWLHKSNMLNFSPDSRFTQNGIVSKSHETRNQIQTRNGWKSQG